MSSAALLGWIVVALLAVMTPGIDTVLVLRHTINGGRRSGFAALTGIALGCLTWATASLVGLTALLAASRFAYDIVRILGAAYLIWLGASAFWRTLPRNRRLDAAEQVLPGTERASIWSGLRAGMFTNLLNPKVGVFYISLLPQFMPTGDATLAWGAVLAAIHLAVTFVWYPAIIWVAVKAKDLLLQQRVRRLLDRLTATVLIGLGLNLALGTR
jgi:threonine/homoserine/homoserine lactone efflux protein